MYKAMVFQWYEWTIEAVYYNVTRHVNSTIVAVEELYIVHILCVCV